MAKRHVINDVESKGLSHERAHDRLYKGTIHTPGAAEAVQVIGGPEVLVEAAQDVQVEMPVLPVQSVEPVVVPDPPDAGSPILAIVEPVPAPEVVVPVLKKGRRPPKVTSR